MSVRLDIDLDRYGRSPSWSMRWGGIGIKGTEQEG